MILIATHSGDHPVVDPVVHLLKDEDVLVYEADLVASGKVSAGLRLSHQGAITLEYGGRTFQPSDVQAAWYRRPNIFGPEPLNKTFLIYLDRQRKACQDSLWLSIPRNRWLNAPEALESAYHDKIVQLQLAHQVGFTIPQTAISNTWQAAFDAFQAPEVLMKLPNGRLYVEEQAHFLTSTLIDRHKRRELEAHISFPGIWQEFITKQKEWRVTVVGNQAFAASIQTAKKAKVDWRRHQFDTTLVKFAAEMLPSKIATQCVDLLELMNLRFGALDLIETPTGDFVFLEVNLNGSYQWLVDDLDLPIPQAIAAELLRIKKSHSRV